jgi:hypothetical protein
MTYDDVTEDCTLSSTKLPYYFTADELNQLITVNIARKPIFMYVEDTTAIKWPWGIAADTYFINNLTQVFQTTTLGLDCTLKPELCLTVNWNNFAYDKTGTALTDGNTEVSFTPPGTGAVIDCTGGSCTLDITLVYAKRYVCNCPLRVIQYTAVQSKEIQIFSEGDLGRSSIYNY